MTPPPPQTVAPVLERTFETGAEDRCRLRIPRAVVILAPTGDKDRATVTLAPAEGTETDAARAFAETLRVRYAEGVLRVEPKRPPRPSASDWRTLREGAPVLALQVRVPPAFGADVHAPGGSINARGLSGPVTLEATGGRVHAADFAGRLDVQAERCQTTIADFDGQKCSAHVHGGSLTVRAATAQKALTVESRAARLHIEDVRGALNLTQQGGSSRLGGVLGPLDAEVAGGRCHLTPEADHATRLRAPGGDVRLALPGDFAADMRLSAHQLSLNGLSAFEGERDDRRADGKLNGGGALIAASAPGGALRCE